MSRAFAKTLDEIAFTLAQSGRYDSFDALEPALVAVFDKERVDSYRANERFRRIVDDMCRANFREGWS